MMFLLAYWRVIALVAAVSSLVGYAAVQKVRFEHERAQYAQYRAEVAAMAAEAEVRNAQAAAQRALNAQEALDDLQARNAALGALYQRVRLESGPGSGPVPALSSAAEVIAACAGSGEQSGAAARRLAEIEGRFLTILEAGDRELGKYVKLWEMGEKNARGLD